VNALVAAQSPPTPNLALGPCSTSPIEVLRRPPESAQFRSGKFVRLLRSHGLIGSMGRTGTCADSAAMESFFALLQKNVLDRQRWSSREELRLAIVIWIERTYHRRRRQRHAAIRGLRLGALVRGRDGRRTPCQFQLATTCLAPRRPGPP
jgi:putative transposase